MATVRTKDELERALKAGEKRILCKGEIEKKLRKQKKLQTAAKVTGGALAATAAVVGGVLAAPFSGGSSLAGAGAAIGMMGGALPHLWCRDSNFYGTVCYFGHTKCNGFSSLWYIKR